MGNAGREFEKFDAVVRKVFSVSHDEIVKREKEYKRNREAIKRSRVAKAQHKRTKP